METFKRFFSGLLKLSDGSADRPKKVTSNGRLANGTGPAFDPYDFDLEEDVSPPKKPKVNGWYQGDQLSSQWETPAPRPSGRKPIFGYTTMSDRYPVRKSVANGHLSSLDTPKQGSVFSRFQPRGRYEHSKAPATPSADYNRRFVQDDRTLMDQVAAATKILPSHNTFSASASTSTRRLSGDSDVEITGVFQGFVAPKSPGPSYSTRSKPGTLTAVPSFREHSLKNTMTAVESYERNERKRQENSFHPPPVPSTSSKTDSLSLAKGRASLANSYRGTESLPLNGFSRAPVDSSFSHDLRLKISSRPATRSTTAAAAAPKKPYFIDLEQEVITIDDSDEENAGTKRNDPAAVSPPKSPGVQTRYQTRLLSPKKNLDLSASRPKSGVAPPSQRSESEAVYEDMYRTRYVPAERRDNIARRVSERVKSFSPADTDFIPLNDEQNQRVDNALAAGHPETEELVEAFKITIRRKDMRTLKGLTWLNDEVANFFLEMIVDRSIRHTDLPKVYTFNTFFYTQMQNKGYSSLKRWTRKVDIFSYDMILVPVHLSSHWCLAVIDLKNRKMKYYDSLGHQNKQCFHLLRTYLEEESKDKKRTDVRLDWETEWEFIFAADQDAIPQQRNMCDCGVFMCKFADFVSRNKEISFTQDNMPYFRRRMSWEILQSKLMYYD